MMFFCTSSVPAATVVGMFAQPLPLHLAVERAPTGRRRAGAAPGPEQLEADLSRELLELRVVHARDRRLDRRHLARGLDRDRAVVEELAPPRCATAQVGEPGATLRVLGERTAVDDRVRAYATSMLEDAAGAGVAGDADALEREALHRPASHPSFCVAERSVDGDDRRRRRRSR